MSGLFGGGSQQQPQQQPSSTSQTTSNIPDWAIPYATKNLGQAEALTDINQNPYQSYQGQRVADFNPMQQQSFSQIGGMQTSPQTGQATNMSGMAGIGSLYAGQNYQNQATSPGAIQAYMSPYQQNVTDYQKQQAISDYGRALPGQGAAAVAQGAFGGSRQAVAGAEGQRNLQNQLMGIQAAGTQDAFRNAQQAQQFGASLGLQGMGQANTAANTLGQLGQQDYTQRMGINAAQQQAGAVQQAQTQQGLSNQYQEFLNQQNYPYKQLGFMSDILRGTPTSGGAQSMYQAPPNMMGMGAGLGIAALNAYAKADGGIINAYKEGGSVRHFAMGGLADPETELAAKSKMPPTNTAEALAKFMLPMIEKMHQPKANPQTTTVAEDMAKEILSRQQDGQQAGIAGLPVDNIQEENYRGGGIVAFQSGGDAENSFDSGEMQKLVNTIPQTIETPDSSAAGKYADLIKTMKADKERYAPESMEVIEAANKAARERQGIVGQVGDYRQAQLEKDQAGEDKRKEQAGKNFWISAGLNMAAEASKRGNPVSGLAAILQPASVGAEKALPGYLAEQEKLKSLTEARNKEMSDIQNSRRAEAAGLVTINQSTKDKQDARIEKIDAAILSAHTKVADSAAAKEAAIAGKAPDAQTAYARAYVNSQIAQGSKVDPVTLYWEGAKQYVRENRAFDPRYAGITQQGISAENISSVALQRLNDEARAKAGKSTDDFLKSSAGRLASVQKMSKDTENTAANLKNSTKLPTDNFEKYKTQLFEDYMEKYRPADVAQNPAPRNPLPSKTSSAEAKGSSDSHPAKGASFTYGSIKGAPLGGRLGELTGRGYEILDKTGKLVGYAQE